MISESTPVTAIVITYAPGRDVLGACMESLTRQNPVPYIIIADNFAPSDPDHKVALSYQSDNVDVTAFTVNHGFGGAINRVLGNVKTPYVLISNFDIVYDPDFMSSAIERIERADENVVGLACKTLFFPPSSDSGWPGTGPDNVGGKMDRGTGAVIDNTGTLVNGYMLAYNRGIGQVDIGQYDDSADDTRPMGACFAAFLARTDAFCPVRDGGVGLLDGGYFMYYEDIDWCYRANILGKKIIYEPRAVAWHHHSLTTRDKSLFFKYHLIQRNLYRTIMKNMRWRTVVKLWAMHTRLHIRRARIERRFAPVTFRILAETLLWAPLGIIKRLSIQPYRKLTDTRVVDLSIGEEGHLDDVSLRPKAEWSNPLASLVRLSRFNPDNPCCDLIPVLEKLAQKSDRALLDQAIKLAETKCPKLLPLFKYILNEKNHHL